jgi:hypothetical protein
MGKNFLFVCGQSLRDALNHLVGTLALLLLCYIGYPPCQIEYPIENYKHGFYTSASALVGIVKIFFG